MNRPHIITLSGKPGSGKSSASDKVAELLGYTRYSSGDIVRSVLKKRHLTLKEFNEKAKDDHTIDQEIDDELRDLRSERDIVIDSRLGFYWIPESFKVYLELDSDVAVARIYKDAVSNAKRGAGAGLAKTIGEAESQVAERLQNERNRFKAMYGVNPFAVANFDLVVDTSRHTPQSVALVIFDNYKKWLKSEEWKQVVSRVPLGHSYQ